MTPKLEHGVDLDGRTGVLLTTPYDETFVDELKTLPRADRRWWPEKTAWWLAAEHASYTLDLMLRFWSRVQVFGDADEGDYTINRGGEIVQQETLF